MTKRRPKAVYICGGDEDAEVVANPCDLCKTGIVRRHRIVGNYTAYVCSNDDCTVNGTPHPDPVEFKGPMPGEDFTTFRNDAVPSFWLNLNALYCERCLVGPTPKLNAVTDLGRHVIECREHGPVYVPHVISGQALANVIAIYTARSSPSPNKTSFRFDREAVEMRGATVRKYVAGDYHAITKEEIALLESDAQSGAACKETAKQMLAKIRLEKGKTLPRSSG